VRSDREKLPTVALEVEDTMRPGDAMEPLKPRWIGYLHRKFRGIFRDWGEIPWACQIRCNQGWQEILEQLCAALEALGLPELKINQIKEKFGGLRVYVNSQDPEVRDLVEQAKQRCAVVCENCGAPGDMRKNATGWWLTLCDPCAAEWIVQGQGKEKSNGEDPQERA
jgi:hypothetical protein